MAWLRTSVAMPYSISWLMRLWVENGLSSFGRFCEHGGRISSNFWIRYAHASADADHPVLRLGYHYGF